MRNILLYLFSHRTLAVIRWDLHFIWIRLTNRCPRLRDTRPLYLNLGSGPRGLSDAHWINVDGYNDTNVRYLIDISRPLPFPDNSFDGIFSEHVLEHFDAEKGLEILSECFRTLRPGSCIRLIIPDGEKILKTYATKPHELLAHRETKLPMEAVNSWFRQRYEHQCIYDFEYLKRQLADAGFNDIKKVGYKVGSGPLLLDDQKYEWESLYVEAAKERK